MQRWKVAVLGLLLALAAAVLWQVLSDEEASGAHGARAELGVEKKVSAEVEVADVAGAPALTSGQKREVLESSGSVAASAVQLVRRVQLVSSLGLRLSAVTLRCEDGAEIRQDVQPVGETGMEFSLPPLRVTEVGSPGHVWVALPDGAVPSVTLEPLVSAVFTGLIATPAAVEVQLWHWSPDERGELVGLGWSQRLDADRHAIAIDPGVLPKGTQLRVQVSNAAGHAAHVAMDLDVRRHWELSVGELLGDAAETLDSEGYLRIVGAPPQVDVRSALWDFGAKLPRDNAVASAADRWPPGLTVVRQPVFVPGQSDGGLTDSGSDLWLHYRAPSGTTCVFRFLDPTTGSWIGHNWNHVGEGHAETVHIWPRFAVRIGPHAVALATGEWIEVKVAERDPTEPDGDEDGPSASGFSICSARFPVAELRAMEEALAHLPHSLEEITLFPRPLPSAVPSASGLVARAWLGSAQGTPGVLGVATVDGYFFDIEASSADAVRMALEGSPEDLAMLEGVLGEEFRVEGLGSDGELLLGRGLLEQAPGGGLSLRLFGRPASAGSAQTLELREQPLGVPGRGTEWEHTNVEDLPPLLALSGNSWLPGAAGGDRAVLLVERRGLWLEIRHSLVFERRPVLAPDSNATAPRSFALWRWMGWGGRAPGPISQEGNEGWFHSVPTGALLEVHEGAGAGGEPASVRTYPAPQ